MDLPTDSTCIIEQSLRFDACKVFAEKKHTLFLDISQCTGEKSIKGQEIVFYSTVLHFVLHQ